MTQSQTPQIILEAPDFQKVENDAQVSIAHFWKNKNIPMVRLIHPVEDQVADFTIESCGESDSAVFMLLRHNDQNGSSSFVVKLNNASQTQTLSEDITGALQWCEGEACQNLLAERFGITMLDLSGDVDDKQLSTEQKLYHELTKDIDVSGALLRPNTKLHIVRCTAAHDYAFVVLRNGEQVLPEIYSVQFILAVDGLNFCLLKLPPDITADDPLIPIFVLKVDDRASLSTLSNREFESVKRKIVDEIKNAKRQSFETISQFLG